jgi:predicted MFS family arabinose efflux permease
MLAKETSIILSLAALRIAVFADAAVSQMLGPNCALMVFPDAHPDSFSSTSPFGFSSAAWHFIPMTAQLATGLASTTGGHLSDKHGRRPMIIANLIGSVVFTLAKYFFFFRKSFWAFNAANFFNGLFSATLTIAITCVSDAFEDRQTKDAQTAMMSATMMLGRSCCGGGMIAIFFESRGLFGPLWPGAALVLFASVSCMVFLIETDPKREN